MVPTLFLVGMLMQPAALEAAPSAAATFTLEYQQSERKWNRDGEGAFGKYLGTGTGTGTGALQGRIGWDLYEDQSRDDLHPAHFHGFVERDGKRHPFQVIGVFTPVELDKSKTWGSDLGASHASHWTLSGTIVFEDESVLGARQGTVAGAVDLTEMKGKYTVWVDRHR